MSTSNPGPPEDPTTPAERAERPSEDGSDPQSDERSATPSTSEDTSSTRAALPSRPVERLTRPVVDFLHIQAAAGGVLLVATIVALIAANTGLRESVVAFWEQPLVIQAGSFELDYPLWYWVNDGLMTVFFFVIGLEIKRELVWGELRDKRNVILPAAGALGGALVPLGIYLALQPSLPGRAGWAIPMATDIAFVVGAISLLGTRVPSGLKVFLLSLAIIDDILAVLVIAIFFASSISGAWLIAAVLGIGLLVLLNRMGVRRIDVYVAVGIVVWLCTLKSGIHPTVAGVVIGLLTPASAWIERSLLREIVTDALPGLGDDDEDDTPEEEALERESAHRISFAATESVSPLHRLEHALHPWSSFVIMPIFALANAGVVVSIEGMLDPIAVAVTAGLVLGKPIGILGFGWVTTKLRLASLPTGVTWPMMLGGACLAGIGFTMALFIASLSLSGAALASAKSGILIASLIAGVVGMSVLWVTCRDGEAESVG